MADHTVSLDAYVGGAWTNVAGEALQGRRIQIDQSPGETWDPRAGKIAFTFHDPADKWRPTNPESPVYGQAGRAMPVRVTVDGVTRIYCEAYSFQPDVPAPKAQRVVHVQAAGLLQRIGGWKDLVRSPIRRMLDAQPGAAYIPGEDPSGVDRPSSGIAGGAPGLLTEGTAGDENAPGGAKSSITLRTAGVSRLTAQVRSWTLPTDGHATMFYAYFPTATPVDPVTLAEIRAAGRVTRWVVTVRATAVGIIGYDNNGTQVVNEAAGWGFDPVGRWIAFQLECEESGGTVQAGLVWHEVGSEDFYTTPSIDHTGTADRLWNAAVIAPVDDTQVCHLWLGDDLLPFVDPVFMAVSDGYRGETAGARWLRLLAEAGIERSILGTAADTQPMGPQKPDTLIGLIKELVTTEDGLVYDSRNALRLVLRTRTSMINQAPKLELTWNVNVAAPLQELIDDQGTWNQVTVTDRSGAEASAQLDTGPLSVQPSPDGIGEVKNDSIAVNVADPVTDLPRLAGYWLQRGSAQGFAGRYPEVVVDLDANPELTADADSVLPGDRITITGRDPEVISLIVLAIKEAPTNKRRVITFSCTWDTVWSNVGIYDDAGSRHDLDSLLVGAESSTSTSWEISSTHSKGWSSTAVPYDLQAARERVTCTAATSPVLSGGVYTQTLTVVRSVNGVVKAQTAGTVVSLADPVRYAR